MTLGSGLLIMLLVYLQPCMQMKHFQSLTVVSYTQGLYFTYGVAIPIYSYDIFIIIVVCLVFLVF